MESREEILRELDPFIHYPESDGKPMADNTLQALWIIMLYDNLKILLKDQLAFIAADHFWYPVMGNPTTVIAPDIMVALGDRIITDLPISNGLKKIRLSTLSVRSCLLQIQLLR